MNLLYLTFPDFKIYFSLTMDQTINLEKQAVDAAISLQWNDAIKLNKKIVSLEKKNVDAYLRLAFAYLQLGRIRLAKKYYRQALKYQPHNYVILENLERIKVLETKKISHIKASAFNPFLFIDIPGKTMFVTLVNCGQKSVLARLTVGQELALIVKKRRIEVRTKEKDYIGCLPDDLSKRLMVFIKAGSDYCCYIKEAGLKFTTVFLKEVSKGKKVAKYISFPTNIQANLSFIGLDKDDETQEEEGEDTTSSDLEKLAESLTEEKVYLPYQTEEAEEESEE